MASREIVPAAGKLATWLRKQRAQRKKGQQGRSDIITQVQLAQALGVRQPSVSRWCAGVGRPSPVNRTAIEGITGVLEHDWLTRAERARLRRARTTQC